MGNDVRCVGLPAPAQEDPETRQALETEGRSFVDAGSVKELAAAIQEWWGYEVTYELVVALLEYDPTLESVTFAHGPSQSRPASETTWRRPGKGQELAYSGETPTTP